MRSLMRGLLGALQLLTVIPIRRLRPEIPSALTVPMFPIVGLLLGAVLAATFQIPLPPLSRAALVLGLSVVLTGGLHEDGWMDAIDAAFAPGEQYRRVEILQDPHIGAHGLTGGVLALLLRFAALSSVDGFAVLFAPIVGRWTMALSLGTAPMLKTSRLAARYAENVRPGLSLLTGGIVFAGICLLSGRPLHALLMVFCGAMAALVWGRLLLRRLGGFNGDCHGAVGMAAELGALWAGLAWTGTWS